MFISMDDYTALREFAGDELIDFPLSYLLNVLVILIMIIDKNQLEKLFSKGSHLLLQVLQLTNVIQQEFLSTIHIIVKE